MKARKARELAARSFEKRKKEHIKDLIKEIEKAAKRGYTSTTYSVALFPEYKFLVQWLLKNGYHVVDVGPFYIRILWGDEGRAG